MKKIIMAACLFIMITGTVFAKEGGIPFESRGTITEIKDNEMTVWSETIYVDRDLFETLHDEQVLKVGNIVNVKGVIVDNRMRADDVVLIGKNHAVDLFLTEPVPNGAKRKQDEGDAILTGLVDAIKNVIDTITD